MGPASEHRHDDPVSLDHLVVSATPFESNQVDLAQATTVVSGLRLQTLRTATLGETLASEPGMSSTYFGPGASRPILRGQGGDRLRLLENGSSSFDASGVSPDHAVSIEPFLVRRIEVVRGPAALLYGSSAIGGAVNVITHRIDEEAPTGNSETELMLSHDSASNAWARGGSHNQVLGRFGKEDAQVLTLHLDAFRRDTGDLRIPGHAEHHEHGEETGGSESGQEREGVLPNSSLHTDGGAVGLSLIGADFHLGASWSAYNSNYGVPGHDEAAHGDAGHELGPAGESESGVRIALRQRRLDVQGELNRPIGPFSGARFKFGRADYGHSEIEPSGEVGTHFENQGTEARAEFLHGSTGDGLAGALGLQYTRNSLAAFGEEAFVPPSLTRSGALFAFENYRRGRLSIQAGARLEQQRIRVAALGGNRKDTLLGLSLGTVWKASEALSLTAQLGRSSRAPNAQELHADGPHAGTASYEVGDATLDREKVTHAELGLRAKTRPLTAELSVFVQDFGNHLHDSPTGLVAIEGDDGIEFVDTSSPAAAGGLPVYRMTQGAARISGLELDTRWHLHHGELHSLDLRVAADLVRATGDEGPLPRIPPARTTVALEWRQGPWGASLEWRHAFAQRRVAANEETSPSHELVSAALTHCLRLGKLEADLFLRASNLLDREIRPHTSFLRDLAPLPGRSFSSGVTLRF